MDREPEHLPSSGFLVIQTASDKMQQTPAILQNNNTATSPQPGLAGQTGRGASVVNNFVF